LGLIDGQPVIRRLGVGAVASMICLLGVTSLASTTATASPNPAARAPHIMTIMMENTDHSQFVGSPQEPMLPNETDDWTTTASEDAGEHRRTSADNL
jgi:hypothetical protein